MNAKGLAKNLMMLPVVLSCLAYGQFSLADELMDPSCYTRYRNSYDDAHRDKAIPYFAKSSMYAGSSTLAAGTSTLAGSVVIPAIASIGPTLTIPVFIEWVIGSVVMGVPVAGIGHEIKEASQIAIDDMRLGTFIYNALNEEIGAGIVGGNLINIHGNLVAYMTLENALANVRNAQRLSERPVSVEEVATALTEIAQKGLLCEMSSTGEALSLSSGKEIFYALLSSIAESRGQ